ncbi:MAG: bifunctional 2-C-methyl-D-erythritol 4-phosphate cytidylyltransferase/2-C-methyl-D-erythritol 2,4-cyclodiphosphate synthase [Campylobacterota bacterium]|nr:bifunctional 2-C-methyl-D-erythritol 4-phosphate cytidylyltransferase/2-C-methyl-D-erythritol 2,4-cyclodiphosphate synthase [Campylobacterota bacterium]
MSQNISLVILCAGNSTRFGLDTKKQWLRIEHAPLWHFVMQKLRHYYGFDSVIVTAHKDEVNYMHNFIDDSNIRIVAGGNTRQESMKNALQHIDTSHVMVTDVARACISEQNILNLIKHIDDADCIVPFMSVSDTVIFENSTIDRDEVKLIQTPQLSKTSILKNALECNTHYTDDSSAIQSAGGTIKYVVGEQCAKKLTHAKDLQDLSCLNAPSPNTFTGFGYDVHQFEQNKPMLLGGVTLDVAYGFKAHSDGDVLIHSIIDALLGACGAGDIGEFFPDTDAHYKNANSAKLLTHITTFIRNIGYEIINIDVSIIAEQPKITPYKSSIKENLSTLLNLPKQFINIKASTSEKMGFIGKKEGVAVHSIATLKYYNWRTQS